jgi:hypothetical protein
MCSWCGLAIEPDDGYRAYEPAGERVASFCRLEHVVPWAIQGPHWEAGETPAGVAALAPDRCSRCEAELTETLVLLIRHRGEHRIADAFCSAEHLREWAGAGGRWA